MLELLLVLLLVYEDINILSGPREDFEKALTISSEFEIFLLDVCSLWTRLSDACGWPSLWVMGIWTLGAPCTLVMELPRLLLYGLWGKYLSILISYDSKFVEYREYINVDPRAKNKYVLVLLARLLKGPNYPHILTKTFIRTCLHRKFWNLKQTR